MKLFVFGLGYSAFATLAALRQAETSPDFAGTRRNADAPAPLDTRLHAFDGQHPGETLAPDLVRASHLLVSIPPDDAGDPVLRHHRDTLDAATELQWIGYFSTVGVYGDFGGAWIDESAPCRPVNKRSQMRVAIEEEWRGYANARGIPLLILRLAGIYGPGRSGFDKLRLGTARRIVKPGQVFNRIHVEDIGRVTALAAQAKLNGTFNLADSAPTPPQDVVAYAADLLGVPAPVSISFETAEMTPMARSFYADNKRVDANAITRALGIELLYPSYKEGLRAILQREQSELA